MSAKGGHAITFLPTFHSVTHLLPMASKVIILFERAKSIRIFFF